MPQVSVVVPTYNERDSLPELLAQLFAATGAAGIDAEVIVVDDNSPDGTADAAEELGREMPVRVVRRSGKLGLASAVIEGFAAASGEVLGVMDADLSHPPQALPRLMEAIREGADLAIGSRYVPGGGTEGWPLARRVASRVACLLAYPLCGVRDATSGFFLVRRSAIEGVELEGIGFKIGLEVMVKGRHRSRVEVPYVFRDRVAGKSKFGSGETLRYLRHLLSLAGYKARRLFAR